MCVGGDLFPIDSSEWADSDNDGIGDNSDPTPFGDIDDNQNNQNGTGDLTDNSTDSQQDSDAESSDSTSNRMVLIGGSIGLIVILIAVGLFITLRNRGDEVDEKRFAKEEELFDTMASSIVATPTIPPITARGEMIDGYEAIQFPAGSGNWFYRDPTTGAWIEWR